VRVAAIDCGTNSLRLLVADLDAATGSQQDLVRELEIVRLGEGVDHSGHLAESALQRTFAVCDAYARTIRAFGADRVRFVATSASRDADNSEVFVAGVVDRIGVRPEVISGAQEAELSFVGSTRELLGIEPGPFLVVDIGGGSTEFVFGERAPEASRSVNIGCVRMTERHLTSDPPTASQIDAAGADILGALDEAAASVDLTGARTLLGLAGTVTTLAALDAGAPEYDEKLTHHYRLGAGAVHALTGSLLAMTRAERAALPAMHPGRADVIAAGALILDQVVGRSGMAEVLVSEHDILDGIAWSTVASRPDGANRGDIGGTVGR
jgi:exopolyphosphatase / guanosine-5'-triphosphate,3'-diphosphate pyrophosphatase